MCGVVGFSSDEVTQEHLDLLNGLIAQSKIRGLHSFGYTYYDGEFITNKYFDMSELDGRSFQKLIYHNRYSTSGDYKDHNNNQPIEGDEIHLVFNGVLDMGTKEEMELKYDIKMNTDNDGEILIKKCGSDKEKIKRFVEDTTGSFAGLILTRSNELLAIRNPNRPLWKLNHEGAVYFASTRDIFKRVDDSLEPEQLNPYQLYEY